MISTSTFFKKVDINSFLSFDSGHYKKWKINISYGQYRRIRKNCTNENKYHKQSKILKQPFKEKGYPNTLIKEA